MKKNILIIDDDQDFAASTKAILDNEGFEITSVQTGAEGFQKAREKNIDFILLDVMMENTNAGLDTVKKLKDDLRTKNIPVIILTGIRKPEYLLQSYASEEKFLNVKKILEKPVKPGELLEILKKNIRMDVEKKPRESIPTQ